jgi:hypothetical protein
MTKEEQLIKTGIETGTLNAIKEHKALSLRAKDMITTCVALISQLGLEHSATQSAFKVLHDFKSDKETIKREKSFSEKVAIRDALDDDDKLRSLLDDDRISQLAQDCIVTYLTIKNLDGIDSAINYALLNLKALTVRQRNVLPEDKRPRLYTKTITSGIANSTPEFFNSLSKAIKEHGFSEKMAPPLNSKYKNLYNHAWHTINPAFKTSPVTIGDVTFTSITEEEYKNA